MTLRTSDKWLKKKIKARRTEQSDVCALSVVFQLVEGDGKFRPPKKEIVT